MIRFLFRWLFRAFIASIVLATGLFLIKDLLLREWVLYRLRTVTGLETRLEGIRTAFLAGSCTLTDLRLYNSAEFGGGLLLSVPDLHLELDRSALKRREFRFQLGRLHLAEFNLVRDARGETNIMVLARTVQERASAVDAILFAPPGFEFTGIELLNLTVGTVRILDLAHPVVNRELNVGITNEIVRNVRSSADFTPLVLRVLFRELSGGFAPRSQTTPQAPAPQSNSKANSPKR